MRRPRGFTLIELLIVVSLIGVMIAVAFPRFQSALASEARVGARREVVAQLARARSAAVQRGCRSTLHLSAGTDRVWVTACKISGSGVDTVGMVSNLAGRYRVDLTSSASTLDFAPTSLALGTASITLGFARSGQTTSMTVSSIGRATW